MKLSIVCFCLCVIMPLAALDRWEEAGFTVHESSVTNGTAMFTLSDALDRTFLVEQEFKPDQETIRTASQTRNAILLWENLVVKSFRIYLSDQGIQYHVIPERFMYKGRDYAQYLPAGMLFFSDDDGTLRYSFRMIKNNISMKLDGRFISLREFSLQLEQAVLYPLAYADRTNYLARLDKVDYETQMLRAQYHELLEKHAVTQTQLKKLRYAVLRWQNEAAGRKGLMPSIIRRIVTLKESDAALGVAAIQQTMQANGITVADAEIQLVLDTYFNAFNE